MMKSYSELVKFKTFNERLNYLSLEGVHHTSPRSYSGTFFKSRVWLHARDQILSRDLGLDLGLTDTSDILLVHHINPITQRDLDTYNVDVLLDPENLITTTVKTHNLIHYGKKFEVEVTERKPGDTKLW